MVKRIADVIPARGSFTGPTEICSGWENSWFHFSSRFTRHLLGFDLDSAVRAKGSWSGVRLNGAAFLWLCLGKTNLCSHVTFMRVFSVLGMLLCILDGSEYVFLVVWMWLNCFCRVVLSLCCCCHFPDDDVNSRSGSRCEESHEGSKLWVWGKHVVSLLKYVVVYCCRFRWNGFPWTWIVDCWTCLWDRRFWFLFELMDYTSKGG